MQHRFPSISASAGSFVAGLVIAGLVMASALTDALPASRTLGAPVGADAPAYCRIASRLLQFGSLEMPPPDRISAVPQQSLEDLFGTPYSLARDGRLLPKHSFAFALLLTPGFAAAGDEGALLEAALIGALLAGFVTVRVASVFGTGPALLSSLALFILSPGGRYVATAINIDTVLALGLVLAFALASEKRPMLAGLVAGVLPAIRPTAPLLFVALPLLLYQRGGSRFVRAALVGALPGIVYFGISNTILWGAPWVTSYHRSLVFRNGKALVVSHANEIGAPTLHGLYALLLAPSNGLLAMAPVVAVALVGFLEPRARSLEHLGVTIGAATGLLSLSGYAFLINDGVGAYRFGFPLLVSSAAPLAALLHRFALIVRRRDSTSPSSSR